ncbi:MAG: putative signal transducing protein [Candidatus Kapaibacterium sp.]
MMKCPVCLNEIEDNRAEKCPHCGAQIETEEFGEVRRTYPWVMIYTTNTELDAEMFRANLESADIPTRILSQIDTTRMFTVGSLALVKIYVPSPFVTDAIEIIRAIESGPEEGSDGEL